MKKTKAMPAARKVLAAAIAVIMSLTILLPVQMAFAADTQPYAVDGRTLLAAKAGDSSDWIEIARYNGYSLIIRKTPLSSSATYFNTNLDNTYWNSLVRCNINNWYNNTLRSDSKLRSYAVTNNAINCLGTYGTVYVDGISLPNAIAAPKGNDVAFALSFCEAAFYCSTQYINQWNNPTVMSSSTAAYNNYHKLLPKYAGTAATPAYWLRSPGTGAYYAGNVVYQGGDSTYGTDRVIGRTSQDTVIGTYGHYRPALWVGSGIFDENGTVNVIYKDADSGAILGQDTFTVVAGAYGPYLPKTFAGYDAGTLAPGSDPASGTINASETKNITYLYKKSITTATITVIHKDLDTNAVLSQEVLTVPAGAYGPYNSYPFSGYSYVGLAAGSAPASGTIGAGQAITITFGYTKAAPIQKATIIVIHRDMDNGSTIWRDDLTVDAGAYSYNPYPFSGYMYWGLDPASAPASGTIAGGETKTIIFDYTKFW